VLGNWYPHFTLLNPYSGHDVGGVASLLTRLFEPSPHITMRSKVRSPMTEAGRSQRPIIRSAPLQIEERRPRSTRLAGGMHSRSIPPVINPPGLELSEPLIAQQSLYFRTSAQAEPDWSQVWLTMEFESKERATDSLFGNERHHSLDPFRLPWKLEGVAVLKLLHLLMRSHEGLNNLTSCRLAFPGEQAG
jgi:hypothetical protein